jgi:hypothetical protein
MRKSVQRLKLDRSFLPSSKKAGEEFFANGLFEFNITQMLEFVEAHPTAFPREQVVLTDISAITPDGIDERAIQEADLLKPVILAEISPGNFNLIDGHHRLARARREGRGSLWAYRVGPEHHTRFLTSFRAYEVYVAYWNDKVRALTRRVSRSPSTQSLESSP